MSAAIAKHLVPPRLLSPYLATWRGMQWVSARSRKPDVCWMTGVDIRKGEEVFRPLTNGLDRFRRVLAAAMRERAGSL